MNKWRFSWQKFVMLTIATGLIIFISGIIAFTPPQSVFALPQAQVHELPQSLAKWSYIKDEGDYLRKIETTPLGYLIWSKFPVNIYVQQPIEFSDSAADKRYQEWVNAAKEAIAEWNVYLPLKEISKKEQADITILRSQPKREAKLNPNTGLYDIPRAVTAETTYKFYIRQNPAMIGHKMKVKISPNYSGISLLATIRHELGHALGIWGHSPNKDDALYFSQVSNPPGISDRDINTLKKIYQQPTKLGWKI